MTPEEVLELYENRDKSLVKVEDNDWISEGKYEYRTVIVKYEDRYYSIDESRSGSYFTYYEYDETTISEVIPKEETVVVTRWIPV